MKNWLILLFTVFTILNCAAQGRGFVGDFAEAYVGHKLVVKPRDPQLQKYGFSDFFKRPKSSNIEKDMIAPIKDGFATQHDAIAYRQFYCESVFVDSTSTIYPQIHYWMRLKNDTLGIVYYRYNAKMWMNFPLESLDDISITQEKICSKIQLRKDKFEGRDRWFTPIEDDIALMKVKSDSTFQYYLSIQHPAFSPTFNKGVILLFEDGSKLSFPNAKVETDVKGSDYYIKSFISLSTSDLEVLKTKELTDARIYVAEKKIRNGWLYKAFAKCF